MITAKSAPSGSAPQVWTRDLPDCVSGLRFSADGSLVAAASLAGPVEILRAATGVEVLRTEGHAGGTLAMAWSSGGRLLVTGGQDGAVRFQEVPSGRTVALAKFGSGWVEHLAWSPDGATLAAAAGRAVRFFDLAGHQIGAFEKHESTVTGLAWVPDGSGVVSSCYGGLSWLEPALTEPKRQFTWKGSILALAMSPDGRFIATGNQDASMHLWVVKTGKELFMNGYPTKVRSVLFTPDSKHLASGAGKAIVLWDMRGKGPAGTKPRILKGHLAAVTDMAFIQNGEALLSCGEDGTVRAWTLGAKIKSMAVNIGTPLERLAVSPHDDLVATGGRTGRVTLFRI
jgi:WD40 repeat protein